MLNSRMKFKKKRKGFTLIEIVTVMVIISILALIAAPNYYGYQKMVQYRMIDVAAKQLTTASITYSFTQSKAKIRPERVSYNAANLEKFVEMPKQLRIRDNNNRAVTINALKALVVQPADIVSGYITEDIRIGTATYPKNSYVCIVYTCPERTEKYRVYVGGVYVGEVG